jgi:cell wall-associated NlpC family hydrolase
LIKRVLIAALSILTITSGIAAPDKKARRTQSKKIEVSRKASSKSSGKRVKVSTKKESRRSSSETRSTKSRRNSESENRTVSIQRGRRVYKAQATTKTTPKSAPRVVTASRTREIARGKMLGENVNVRSAASSNANLITKVSGGEVAILAKQGEWFKLRFRYGSEGWVRQDFVEVYGDKFAKKAPSKPEPKVAKAEPKREVDEDEDSDPASAPVEVKAPVTTVDRTSTEQVFATLIGDSINVRRGPSTSNSVITKVKGGKAEIIDKWGDWYKLKFQHGTTGWVRNDFLEIPGVARPAAKRETESVVASAGSTDKTDSVLRSANRLRGTRYVWGGTSSRGTDCSGFTLQVFRANGITLPRTAREQVHCGTHVKRSELQPGDLIFFNTKGYVSHVGIYIGGNRFIHASSGGRKVQENSLTGYYSNKYITARRVIKGGTKLSFPKAGSDLGELDSTPQAAPGTDIIND